MQFFVNGGFLINLGDDFKWKINSLIKTDLKSVVIDLNNRLTYRKMYWMGFTLRSTTAYGVQGGIVINDTYKIGYAYDRLGGFTTLNTHEFILSFTSPQLKGH